MTPAFTITHRCLNCRTLACEGGICSSCDEWLTPLEATTVADPIAPAPVDWPEAEPADEGVHRAPRTRTTTRTAPVKRTRKVMTP